MTTIIKNVKVFDGVKLSDCGVCAIENDKIVDKTDGDVVIDAGGCTLLPGLIDSHVHLYGVNNIKQTAKYGVTTVCDMGVRSHKTIDELKSCEDVSRILSSFSPAFAPNSRLRVKMGFPDTSSVADASDSARFVTEQIGYGADYIKIIIEDEGKNDGVDFPKEILKALVDEAHSHGKRVVSHIVSPKSFDSAISVGVDVLTHIPFIADLPPDTIEAMKKRGSISVPTMIAMKLIVDNVNGLRSKPLFRLMRIFSKKLKEMPPLDYSYVERSVAKINSAGITILAGSDSNTGDKKTPFSAEYGSSLHEELRLMVRGGMTPTAVLQSATSLPAKYWGLHNIGYIAAGYQADLLLVEGDPTKNIDDTLNIKGVWIAGKRIR